MSLRMSSLDPNEPRAAKDCRTCNRRRIRCDRSLPTCRKCALKDLTCPGYGLRIQFGQGVASRGKLMGKALPVIEAAPRPSLEEPVRPQSLSPGDRSEPSEEVLGLDPSTFVAPYTLPTALQSSSPYDAGAFQNPFALNIDLSPYALPRDLEGHPVRELVHYYDNHVATLMPWVDGPDNPWRTLLIPLALTSPSLLHAVLALSAEHYSSRPQSTWPANAGFFPSGYRDKSLKLLAQDLQTELDEDASSARQAQASSILATILLLCNLEMIRCETGTWHVHWKAARTIARRWTAPHLASTILDDTCRFLLKEAFVYDVFGSSTTFGNSGQIPGSVLTDSDAGIFTHWLQLIQEVTCTERRRAGELPSSETPSLDFLSLEIIQQKFEYARERCRHFSQSFDFGTPSPNRNFLVLIDVFHHAGLAYSFSALLDPLDPAVHMAIETNVGAVIDDIEQIQHDAAYHHDLVWPLFIVGTQGRNNHTTQQFAQIKLLEVMESTNFSNCLPALEFLQRFWLSDPNVVPDWRYFARQESKQGHHFLVI